MSRDYLTLMRAGVHQNPLDQVVSILVSGD